MTYRSDLRDLGPCCCSSCDACEFNDLLACIEESSMWAEDLLDAGKIDLREGLELLNDAVF